MPPLFVTGYMRLNWDSNTDVRESGWVEYPVAKSSDSVIFPDAITDDAQM
jgi:hypothetical protein